MSGKIRKPPIKKGLNLSAKYRAGESTNHLKPIFSLELLQSASGYCLSNCNKEQKAAFADALLKRSKMSWSEIIQNNKHKLGCETIKRKAITAPIPSNITEDTRFIALRFYKLAPMVGYREGQVFYILWLDHSFTLYPHS